jgi:hypothetical protein
MESQHLKFGTFHLLLPATCFGHLLGHHQIEKNASAVRKNATEDVAPSQSIYRNALNITPTIGAIQT